MSDENVQLAVVPPQLLEVVEKSGVELESAQVIQSTFSPYFVEIDKWRTQVQALVITSADQKREMKLARETRLALREIRINAEKARKRLKEDSVRRGKAIDGAYNILEFLITPLETHLKEQEDFVELQEKKRKEALRSTRLSALATMGIDGQNFNLGEMSDEEWQKLYSDFSLAAAAKERAAREAEAERQRKEAADAAERERLRQENERLHKEAQEREAAARMQREKEAAERAEIQKKIDAEREARIVAEKAAAAETERKLADLRAQEAERARQIRHETEAREKRIRAERDRAQQELNFKRQEEERRTREAAEVAARAAQAPDKEKLLKFIDTFGELDIPEMSTPQGKLIAAAILEDLQEVHVGMVEAVSTL